MVLFAVLDGACCGCFVCVLPAALQALLEDAPEPLPHSPTRTGAVLAALLLGALLGGAGRALSSFLNALSLSKSSLLAVLLCAITFFVFSFSSSLAWLLSLRLVLGVLSGYLGYFVEVDRASGLSRAAWVLAAGAACCMCAALYATPHSSQSHSSQSQSLMRWQPVRTNSPFLLEHPLCLSLSMLAASVIAFFAFYVLAEKFGVLDDDDERLYRASSSYMPVSSSCARKPVMYSVFICVRQCSCANIGYLSLYRSLALWKARLLCPTARTVSMMEVRVGDRGF